MQITPDTTVLHPSIPTFASISKLFNDDIANELNASNQAQSFSASKLLSVNTTKIYKNSPDLDLKNIPLDNYELLITSLSTNLMVCKDAQIEANSTLDGCIQKLQYAIINCQTKKKMMAKAIKEKQSFLWHIKKNRVIDQFCNAAIVNFKKLLQNFK